MFCLCDVSEPSPLSLGELESILLARCVSGPLRRRPTACDLASKGHRVVSLDTQDPIPKLVYEHRWSLLIKKALGSSKLPPLAEWVILKLCDSFPTITHNFKGYTKMTDDKERSIMGHIFLWAAGAHSHFIFIFQMTFNSFGSFVRHEAAGIILPPTFLSMFFFFFNYLLFH